MDKFINESIGPLLPETMDEETKKQKIALVQLNLKFLIKGEIAGLNKEIAKKSRELFILSSDIETYKEKIDNLQTSLQKARYEFSNLDQEKQRQKMDYEKKISDLKNQFKEEKNGMKKDIMKLKNEKQEMDEEHKYQVKQLRKSYQNQIQQSVEFERQRQEEILENRKKQFEEEKKVILKENNDKKKEMIKKYEEKIYKLKNEQENKLKQVQKQHEEYRKEEKQVKYRLQTKLTQLENDFSRLTSEHSKQQSNHKKYKQLYDETFKELSEFQEKATKIKESIESELFETKKKLTNEEKQHSQDNKNLNKKICDIIEEKDKKFVDTVEFMSTQHRIKLEATENEMMEERQIAVNTVQIARDRENYQNHVKYNQLNEKYEALENEFKSVSQKYETKIKSMEEEYYDNIESLNSRKQYELVLAETNSSRQFSELLNKYELQIKYIHSEHENDTKQMNKKFQQEKIVLTNKLTTQYEQMLSDQKSAHEIQIKQKLIEFDRKTKNYESKLKEADKKRNEVKIAGQRVKMEMQMRIDSMIEVNEAYELEVANLNERIQENEREKSLITNQYELKILRLRNEMKQQRDEFEIRENDLKEVLQSKLYAKNRQTTALMQKLKKETEDLINKHDKRVKALEKEYNELRNVVGQKTSLPEDIEALKVFHAAFLQKEQELEKAHKRSNLLERQLMAKDATDRVFAEKAYHRKTNGMLLSFKSNQI